MTEKVVFIASHPGSIINFRLHLIKEFLARGYAVVVIAPADEKVAATLNQMGIKFISVKMERNGYNPLSDLSLLFELSALIRKEQPQIVFSYTIKPVIYGTLAAKIARVPHIYAMLTGTGYIFSNYNLKSKVVGKIARALFRFSLRFNKKLFFQNKDNLASFIDYKLIKTRHPYAIINGSGVDVDYFACTPLPKKMSFLMISRLLYDKGIREYIEAARMIKSEYPHVTFKLVGWIDTNPNSITQKDLDNWIRSGVIEYLGKLSDVRGAIADSSVYVLPSYGEGTPRTVLEAMAMGRPIITTDVAGCRETVINEQNGYLVPVCNAAALEDAMKHFLNVPEDIEKMGRVSRRIAEEKYDVNKVNKCILAEMDIHDEFNTKALYETKI